MKYEDYQELIDLNNQTIEMYLDTIMSIQKNEENEITMISIKNGLDYPTLMGMYNLISDCYLENIKYQEEMQEIYKDLTNF